MSNKRNRKPDDESVISLTKKYIDAESKFREIIFSPPEQPLHYFQQNVKKELDKTVKGIIRANKSFVNNSLSQAYTAGKRQTDRLFESNDIKPKPEIKSESFNGKKEYNNIRRGAFIELNRGMSWAADNLYKTVKQTIRSLDDGNKNLNAFTAAIKEKLQDANIFEVEYKNGSKIKLDSYAKMLSRSSRIETANVGNFQRALELGSDLVKCTEISPTCELCTMYQGRVYSISGQDKRFPALYETALKHGYSLIHPNCRHEFLPYLEVLMSEEDIAKDIKNSNREFTDARSKRERDAYADWQKYNRQVWAEENEYNQMQQTLGDDMPYKTIGSFRRAKRADSEGYKQAKETYKENMPVGIKMTKNRYYDAQQYDKYKEILGKDMPETIAEFQQMKYNNTKVFSLMQGYFVAVQKNDVSPLAGFELYKQTADEINETLVGLKTLSGIEIKGFKTHYVDRTVGHYEETRRGVSVEQAKATLLDPNAKIVNKENQKTGNKSVTYISNGCAVTVNPDTGFLIQTNHK